MDVNVLGFWYMMFQSESARDRVKAWTDGDDHYVYFTHKRLFEFIAQTIDGEDVTSLYSSIRRAVMDSSFFLWDVEKRTITRLSLTASQEPYKVLLAEKQKKEAALEAMGNSVAENYWKSDGTGSMPSEQIKIRVNPFL